MGDTPAAHRAEDNGWLWGYQVDSAGVGTELDINVRRADGSPDGYRWVHLHIDSPGAAKWMKAHELDSELIEALTAFETRPRTQRLQDGVFVALRGVNMNKGSEPDDMVSVRVWFNNDIVISTERIDRRLKSIGELRDAICHAKGAKSPNEWLISLIDSLADRIGDVVDNIDEVLTEFETSGDEQSPRNLREQLSIARRQIVSIRRYLAPQRDALDRLFRTEGAFSERQGFDLHHQTDRMTRHLEELDLARERALVLNEDLQNRIAEEQNSRVYVLSIVAAIFLPLSYLTGVFGMNVAGLPGIENPFAFIYLSIGMGVIAIALIAFMRWRKWL